MHKNRLKLREKFFSPIFEWLLALETRLHHRLAQFMGNQAQNNDILKTEIINAKQQLQERMDSIYSLLVGDIVSLKGKTRSDIAPKTAGIISPDGAVNCLCCGKKYDIEKYIPRESKQATLVCAECREPMELYPHPQYGWGMPVIMSRERPN